MNLANIIKERFPSPLRYPGGKSCLSQFFENIIEKNNIVDGAYCEGFAGGAGAALNLLFSNKVARLVLNDADIHISSFWNSVINNNEEFLTKLEDCRINLDEWHRQREIYHTPNNYSELEIGFSTFFLNRSNRGGILPNAGPTGGYLQNGNYKINSRFKKENLIPRIKQIHEYRDQIEFHSMDAITFIQNVVSQLNPDNTLVYLDPPYYHQGKNLYLNYYENEDHENLANLMARQPNMHWIVSYDNTPEIISLYENYRYCDFDINYSVQQTRQGKEIMFFSDFLEIPQTLQIKDRTFTINN